MKSFTKHILTWYETAKRRLPWRESRDPYLIWLSEIILQQTRVSQGMDYFLRFADKYPRVELLATAPETEVLKLWQGLGYYSRARNMHFAAKQIVNEFDGKFPDEYKQILKLKGVGEYTAAAVASIAFGQPVAVVDGNVKRVMARIFGIECGGTQLYREAEKKMQELIDAMHPGDFNQAVMEFGALQCTPKPDCFDCIFKEKCIAFQTGRVSDLPVKGKAVKTLLRHFSYFILKNIEQDLFIVKRRLEGDIWNGLYDFPMIETKQGMKPDELKDNNEWKEWFCSAPELSTNNKLYKHQLTHRTIYARFYYSGFDSKTSLIMQANWEKVSAAELKKLPVSRLIDRFMKEHPEMFE